MATGSLDMFKPAAKDRQKAAGVRGKEGGRGHKKPSPKTLGKGKDSNGEAVAEAGKPLGVSG
jgi:hypothetical protein